MDINCIKKQVNELLEKTVKKREKYKDERALVFYMLKNLKSEQDVKNLEKALHMFIRILKLEKEI